MTTIEVTGDDLTALMTKHRTAMVLGAKKKLTRQEAKMYKGLDSSVLAVINPRVSFEDWLASEMKILEIRSPEGLWCYGPHELVFATESDADAFRYQHMS